MLSNHTYKEIQCSQLSPSTYNTFIQKKTTPCIRSVYSNTGGSPRLELFLGRSEIKKAAALIPAALRQVVPD